MAVKERLIEYIDFRGVSKSEFCRTIGVSAAFVTSIVKSIQPDKIERIALNYPELNTGWLLTGEGDMLKSQNSLSQLSDTDIAKMAEEKSSKMLMGLYKEGEIYPAAIHQQIVGEKDAKIAELQKRIWILEQQLDAAKK